MNKRVRIAAYGTVAVAALGVGAFAFTIAATSTTTSSVAIEPASQEQPTDGTSAALPCDKVQELERSVQARGAVPGPEQWPPFQPGQEPDAPRPEPPIDPTTGKPKGIDAPPLPSGRAENSVDVGERPCGPVVDTIRTKLAEGGNSFWICYLEDGRYASTVTADGPKPFDTQEARDGMCQTLGYARSKQ